MRQRVQVPVGGCDVAVPVVPPATSGGADDAVHAYAYATVLHSVEKYVCGAIVLARSIRATGSAHDMVVLVSDEIGEDARAGLRAAGWIVRRIERIRNPHAKQDAYNEWNYSKLRLWQLVDYAKVLFIDADVLVLRNMDHLFELPEISAVSNDRDRFNSGMMVIEPSGCTFNMLMDRKDGIVSYNGGDQGFLNEVFTFWHRLPRLSLYITFTNDNESSLITEERARVYNSNQGSSGNEGERKFGGKSPSVEPSPAYSIHYLGMKPWMCFKDYDCNWLWKSNQKYASDAAHCVWWRFHDGLSEELQERCFLTNKRKAELEVRRIWAQIEKFPDGHWSVNVTDARREKCRKGETTCKWWLHMMSTNMEQPQ
eukprot:jgi/Mesen1/1145/ME001236S00030